MRTLYIDAFLGDVLSDETAHERQYILSRAVAAVAYETISAAEGLYYPSTKAIAGTNITMKADTYRPKYRIVCSQLVEITKRRRFGFYDNRTLAEVTGITDDGTLLWSERVAAHRMALFNLTKDEADSKARVSVSR